jgi:hypothetical protein
LASQALHLLSVAGLLAASAALVESRMVEVSLKCDSWTAPADFVALIPRALPVSAPDWLLELAEEWVTSRADGSLVLRIRLKTDEEAGSLLDLLRGLSLSVA